METFKGVARNVGQRPQHQALHLPLCSLPIGINRLGIQSRKPIRWQPCALRHLSRCNQRSRPSLCSSRRRLTCRSEQLRTPSTARTSNVTIDIGQEPVSADNLWPCQQSCSSLFCLTAHGRNLSLQIHHLVYYMSSCCLRSCWRLVRSGARLMVLSC